MTRGPYLNSRLSATELSNADWKSYRQTVVTGDVEFGIGHFDRLMSRYDPYPAEIVCWVPGMNLGAAMEPLVVEK